MSKKKEQAISEKERKKIQRRIKSELEPFFNDLRTRHANFELFRRAYGDFATRFAHAMAIFVTILEDFIRAPAQIGALFLYLGLVESLGNGIVDIIVMLLVANGRDFHIECRHTTPRIKHVTSLKDLEKERVPLTTKLNFLRDNDVKELPSIIDTTLRNDIAHLKFDVREDKVYIKGKLAKDVLNASFGKLVTALETTETCLRQFEQEKSLIPKKE